MGRWEPHARERLVRAALELFTEQGYEKTTVVEIAERARLTKSTFFRHFPDKREVLFAGQDVLAQLLSDGVADAPGSATPFEMLAAALEAVAGAFPEERRSFGPRLRAVIGGNPELQERNAQKSARLGAAIEDGLARRGLPEVTAGLAAQLGTFVLGRAYAEWSDPDCAKPFIEIARHELRAVRAAVDTLDTEFVLP
ncbi:TetR/AcrR family transcriptional regulator [Amycolatopsis jiangsuensis]|uniref:AcrR family transcriptional regulator n=1 Tax=Amycolatopsis jiangsuensis TaxID=1181879 RepID=A0A840J5W7_9PSEU|nr:TetR/AcrR family transcriptional regulator [Amycolatopsis jiangsuensis]MBB4689005.1 AcrR family transcriptional regulator [Amycolatopsis jiangsuensis]